MKKETPKRRAERKSVFIGRATAHFDTAQIRKEASDLWEKANKIKNLTKK